MKLPHFSGFRSACNILIAGTGEDFDLLSALPMYFSLSRLGMNVSLANYSFASLEGGTRITENLVEIDSTSRSQALNFPEKILFDWSENYHIDVPIFCFDRKPGCQRLYEAYDQLCYELELDAIVLIDNGLSTLVKIAGGDSRLSVEAMTSMLAVYMLPDLSSSYLGGLGLGPNCFDENQYGLLNGEIESLFQLNEFKGLHYPYLTDAEAKLFLNACDYVEANMIFGVDKCVNNIASSLEDGSDSTQTAAFLYSLPGLVEKTAYIPGLEETKTLDQVAWELTKFRHLQKK